MERLRQSGFRSVSVSVKPLAWASEPRGDSRQFRLRMAAPGLRDEAEAVGWGGVKPFVRKPSEVLQSRFHFTARNPSEQWPNDETDRQGEDGEARSLTHAADERFLLRQAQRFHCSGRQAWPSMASARKKRIRELPNLESRFPPRSTAVETVEQQPPARIAYRPCHKRQHPLLRR